MELNLFTNFRFDTFEDENQYFSFIFDTSLPFFYYFCIQIILNKMKSIQFKVLLKPPVALWFFMAQTMFFIPTDNEFLSTVSLIYLYRDKEPHMDSHRRRTEQIRCSKIYDLQK